MITVLPPDGDPGAPATIIAQAIFDAAMDAQGVPGHEVSHIDAPARANVVMLRLLAALTARPPLKLYAIYDLATGDDNANFYLYDHPKNGPCVVNAQWFDLADYDDRFLSVDPYLSELEAENALRKLVTG